MSKARVFVDSLRALLVAPIIALALCLSPAAAQNAAPPTVELTRPMIDAFLASLPDLKALGDKFEHAAPVGEGPMAAIQGMAVSAAAKAELDATVKSHGFGDYVTWTIVAQNILSTYTHVKMGDVQAQMSQALAAIESNPQLSENQKTMLRAQIGAATAAQAAAPRPSENNIALVTGMMDEIEAGMEAMDER